MRNMLILNDLHAAAPAQRKCLRCNGLRLFLIHTVKVLVLHRLMVVVVIVVLVRLLVALVVVVVAVVVAGTQARSAEGCVGRQRNTRAANAFHIDLTTAFVIVGATAIFMATSWIIFASHN